MSETSGPTELTELLCFDIYAASRAVTAVYRQVLAELELTYPQYLVLVVLWREQSCPVSELKDQLHLDYGTLTPLLRRMESHGLLTRHRRDDDERSVRVELTAPGGDLWAYGPLDADERVTGLAWDFALLVTQRRHRADLALRAEGPGADAWLDLAQAFAGPSGNGREPAA